MSKKQAAPIPVIGTGAADTSRENELRAWEQQQEQARLEQSALVPQPAAPVFPLVDAAVEERAVQSAATAVDSAEVEAVQETPGYLSMPEFTQPESEDPLERLEHYSRGIHAAQYAARVNHERAEQQKLIATGLRLAAIKEEKLHIPAGFDTFGDLVFDRFGFKKHHANNILRVLDVAIALEDLTTQELKERPLSVLVPVLETHGADAVRKTWIEAGRHGNITEKSLREAATFLGYAPPKELTPPKAPAGERKPETLSPLSGDYAAVVLKIRSLATQDQARARVEAQALLDTARQLVEELSAHGSPASGVSE
ncbi:hypothetical protein [Streptomyces sp. NPDC096351]|uniref:hypothetical protein n=1 Tax=Streptomyces sp. NPDC096351 TaxID=3366087 RepID=UPI00381F358E